MQEGNLCLIGGVLIFVGRWVKMPWHETCATLLLLYNDTHTDGLPKGQTACQTACHHMDTCREGGVRAYFIRYSAAQSWLCRLDDRPPKYKKPDSEFGLIFNSYCFGFIRCCVCCVVCAVCWVLWLWTVALNRIWHKNLPEFRRRLEAGVGSLDRSQIPFGGRDAP